MSLSRCLTCVCVFCLAGAAGASARTISVPAGGDLQAALLTAQPGDTIELAAGAVYTGTFTLHDKQGDQFITLRTAGKPQQLPADGARVSPDDAPRLAKIRSGSTAPAIQTAPGAHHWRIMLVEVQANAYGIGDIITLGDGSDAQHTASQIPHDLVLDRVYVHGDPALGQKRGVALNSASTTITGCYISDMKAQGQDSQAIAGWNGPGPYTITNNYLEAAGNNVIFGGSDPAVPNLVSSDIMIADNHLAKPLEWRSQPWVVKNLLELKNARRVTITHNTLEYSWRSGQAGYAVLFTVRNQSGGCPWCQVAHVRFEGNIVRHAAAGVQILGIDYTYPSLQTTDIAIVNNLFTDIDGERWGGSGYFLMMTGQPRDILVDHNTIIQDHASGVVQLDGPPILGFTYTNNVSQHNAYGFIGTDHGIGNDSISTFLPGSYIARNVLAGGQASRYPADNLFPSVADFQAQFTSFSQGDYTLIPQSSWHGAGTDGLDLGVVYNSTQSNPKPNPKPPNPNKPPAPPGQSSGLNPQQQIRRLD